MSLFPCKTKIVCTIGPASESPWMIEKMLLAGMNVARLNFSHGDFAYHGELIEKIRQASAKTGKQVAIMADLPGPKMRIGNLAKEPVLLGKGDRFTLTAEETLGSAKRVSITMPQLPKVVKPGDILFLSDGLIQLQVEQIEGLDIHCSVLAGGELRSRKGLNIPGIDLGTSAFTERDRECLRFALEQGVEAVSQSFVTSAQDVFDVRAAAGELGFSPFIIAKIERSSVHEQLDRILAAADGIMVARGDLGVEIPIEEIAVAQKRITAKANAAGKPVITATQMLESMTRNRRPTRAESTDVANAILDGTDAVMLSEESAMGSYPLEAVEMLVRIAAATEPYRQSNPCRQSIEARQGGGRGDRTDLIALSVDNISRKIETVAAILVPTHSGHTARSLARFRPEPPILAISPSAKTCQELLFSSGVHPILEENHPRDWTELARDLAQRLDLAGSCIIQTEGPSPAHPGTNFQLEIIALK